MPAEKITLIGAGLAGALLAGLLAKRGFDVTVYERRADPRTQGYSGGRSINLALAERGFHGLRLAGLEHRVLEKAVMMRGRMIHDLQGQTHFQRYGKDDSEVIWSINRGHLNTILLDAAEQNGARIVFEHRLISVDFERQYALFESDQTGSMRVNSVGVLIGSDGAGSALRHCMMSEKNLGESIENLGHGYKELEIPPQRDSATASIFRMDAHSLHIWPRGGYMLIALPNSEGSYTVTLFLPNEGDPSFASLDSNQRVQDFFQHQFPDARDLISDLNVDFQNNPTGILATLRLQHWHLTDKALLLGDAAHAIVPFHGQGMNCAFEDCVHLMELIDKTKASVEPINWQFIFESFERDRKPNANAIADMAIENYIEMRDLVDDPQFLIRKSFERKLAELHPEKFVPRYGLVMFKRVPYIDARAKGAINYALVSQLMQEFTHADLLTFENTKDHISNRYSNISAIPGASVDKP